MQNNEMFLENPATMRLTVISIIIWFFLFGLLAINFGNVLIIVALWYIFTIKPSDDPRRKLRMLIVAFYSIISFILNMALVPSALDRFLGKATTLERYTQIWALFAYAKIILVIVICIKIPKLFSNKAKGAYLARLEKENKERMEARKLQNEYEEGEAAEKKGGKMPLGY